MKNKIVVIGLASILLLSGYGCAEKKATNDSQKQNPGAVASNNQNLTTSVDKTTTSKTPQFHPSASTGVSSSLNVNNLEKQVNQIIDKKFPGEWDVDGTTLKKGSYVENNNYGITDEIAKNIKGSMVSIYVGETRISNTLTSHTGRLLSGYAVPLEVDKTMKSGKAIFYKTKLNQHEYQKAYIPIKNNSDDVIAVIGLSIKTNK